MIEAKKELRRSLLQTRRHLSPQLWQRYSQQICAHLTQSPQFRRAKTILAYFSLHQEPDLTPLFSHPKVWGFPRCVGKTLSWHRWSPGEVLETDRYQIPTPLSTAPCLSVEMVDLILVPAVACDRQGYRLGYGGGFYDRLFSNPLWAEKPTIGIIFSFAYVPTLPKDPWDSPLTAVCTEAGINLVPPSA